MKRRQFLTGFLSGGKQQPPGGLAGLDTGLDKFSGEWNRQMAAHLLRRTLFGASPAEIQTALELGLDGTIDKLLTPAEKAAPPVYLQDDDPNVPQGTTWVNASRHPVPGGEGRRRQSLYSWWFGRILERSFSISEKMALFWHNHYVTEVTPVRDSRFSYRYREMLFENALGNFRELSKMVTVDAAMLIYLNGNTNIVGRPNENYARELFELFTIGKGPVMGEGNYTNYTEHDIIEAAKVLTGWVQDAQTLGARFVRNFHDRTDKTFSEIYGNRTISNANEDEYKILVDMIFEKDETARYICRKLYRWFVYYDIDEATEQNIIEPLAEILRDNDYEIKPVLKALLTSEHFFDEENIGAMIKNPMDYIVGLYKELGVKFPESTDYEKYYNGLYNLGYVQGFVQEMAIGEPPGVAGWQPYYQAPGYQRLWANSVTLPYRAQLADAFATPFGVTIRGYKYWFDTYKFTMQFDNPKNSRGLVKEASERLLPFSLTENQLVYLESQLLDTIPDYEWTSYWIMLEDDPENQLIYNGITARLQIFYRALFHMAEFQLM